MSSGEFNASHGFSVTTGGNWSTRREPAMIGRVKLDKTVLIPERGNLNQTQLQEAGTGGDRVGPLCHQRPRSQTPRHDVEQFLIYFI